MVDASSGSSVQFIHWLYHTIQQPIIIFRSFTEIALVQVTYNKDSKDITVEDSASSADPVCGEYECSQYVDNGNGNDWHYVTVTQEEKGYKWSNRAGVSWMLDAETLDIGDWAAVFKLNHFLIRIAFHMGGSTPNHE